MVIPLQNTLVQLKEVIIRLFLPIKLSSDGTSIDESQLTNVW